jgi:hypothetical protein
MRLIALRIAADGIAAGKARKKFQAAAEPK